MFGKSTRGNDTTDLKKTKTLLHELSKVGVSKNAAVQESGYGYKRKSQRLGSTSALPPRTDIRLAVSAFLENYAVIDGAVTVALVLGGVL